MNGKYTREKKKKVANNFLIDEENNLIDGMHKLFCYFFIILYGSFSFFVLLFYKITSCSATSENVFFSPRFDDEKKAE